MNKTHFDVALIGGGLAGLTCAIDLKLKGFDVILFEKKHYPTHKVCGEYISLESWEYLIALGIPLYELNLPIIKNLKVSDSQGNMLNTTLPLGGFGISRYTLDNLLAIQAKKIGVVILENTAVQQIEQHSNNTEIKTNTKSYTSKLCIGSYGKRSNLDKHLKRKFIERPHNKLNNWIGVKYHISYDFPNDEIALHNFKNGYCGISKVDDNRYCLCYLTKASNLENNNNEIALLEKNVLCKNPHLKHIWQHAKFLYDKPLVISQVDFSKKTTTENNILMLGDTAGLITPLCGNGMSMAMKSAYMACNIIYSNYNNGVFDTKKIVAQYQTLHQRAFANQLKYGRWIQASFGKNIITYLLINFLKNKPNLLQKIISLTHGQNFYKA